MNKTIKLVDVVTGAEQQLVLNETISAGEEFRLISRDLTFRATRTWVGILDTLMVQGTSLCERYMTVARICDTAKPLS